MMREDARYRFAEENEIASPALMYYPEIIRENTRLTIEGAKGASRLWPHVKTHKMVEMIRMQMDMGITRFKCATISEMEMVCACGAMHVLLAYPAVGPNVKRFLDTAQKYPDTICYVIADSETALNQLDDACAARKIKAKWLCDVNMGMNRTGVSFDELEGFCTEMVNSRKHLEFVGFHCYDGQNHQSDLGERQRAVEAQYGRVKEIKASLERKGIPVPIVIAGGSPSFPCFAEENVFLSPGTVFVWDWGYQSNYKDLPFVPGAALLTRVVSHPAKGVFTLDLGCKAIASDPAGQRGYLLDANGAMPMFQSEEHWTWRMPEGREDECPEIGTVMYAIPTHVCPTSALYRAAKTVERGHVTGEWIVAARNRD